jgi:hypothetical protein
MSTLYLVDLHNPVGPSSEINDVHFSETGEVVLGGNVVIRVPDGVSLGSNPTDLFELVTKKQAGLLAFYTGYTRITMDAFASGSNIDPLASTKFVAGDRGTTNISQDAGAILQSVPWTLDGLAPAQCVVTFETFNVAFSTPVSGRMTRTYQETVPGAVVTCDVSFNGGATFLATTDGGLLNIPLPDQGTSFVFRITSLGISKTFLGSWAVIY